jgi:hypothetical protein
LLPLPFPSNTGLGKGAVTPLALFADRENKVKLVFDQAMATVGTDMLFHPITGNDWSLRLSWQHLLRFVTHFNHAPIMIDFSQQNREQTERM